MVSVHKLGGIFVCRFYIISLFIATYKLVMVQMG